MNQRIKKKRAKLLRYFTSYHSARVASRKAHELGIHMQHTLNRITFLSNPWSYRLRMKRRLGKGLDAYRRNTLHRFIQEKIDPERNKEEENA